MMFPVLSRRTLLGVLQTRIAQLPISTKHPGDVQEMQVQEQIRQNLDAGQMTELVRDFLHPGDFYRAIRNIGINFFCGVPDSLLKDFCAYVAQNENETCHIITANEGNAIGLAAGYHLATGNISLVYLQNSGLGNIVNPLVSLAAPEVYSVPMLLLIGWRGEPGKRDEPQHMIQGQITSQLLDTLGIPFSPLPDYIEGAKKTLNAAKQYMRNHSSPYALLVKRQTFLPYKLRKSNSEYPMSREVALKIILNSLHDSDAVVSTTGMLSRELFEHRVAQEQGHERDFLTVGSMGHASSIALGIAMNKPKRQVFCLDGDGSVIMHMGALSIIGQMRPRNLKHIVFNNGAHDSVGGQQTAAFNSSTFHLTKTAVSNGYTEGRVAVTVDDVINGVQWLQETHGPAMLEIKVHRGSRKDLGRPTRSPIQNKADFMNFLSLSAYE